VVEAQRGREPLDLVLEDYERNAELVHWATGNADDSDRGRALAACYARALDALEQPCGWNQRVVIHRTGPRSGEVVHVEQAVGEVERACERMIGCANEAWRAAPAPLPESTDEYFTLEFVANPCFLGEGRDGDARASAFAEREALATESIENFATCDRQACRYNSRSEQGCLTHLAELQRALGEQE
jgi:hypothetical protein